MESLIEDTRVFLDSLQSWQVYHTKKETNKLVNKVGKYEM